MTQLPLLCSEWSDNIIKTAAIAAGVATASAAGYDGGTGSALSVDGSAVSVFGYGAGARFFGVNLLSELDAPGAWQHRCGLRL